MRKLIYISADYSEDSGDREVIEILNKWGNDNCHKVNFCDMAKVVTGSVSNDPDCRICDLKKEFNKQINASSAVIFVIGDKTASRKAGNTCERSAKNEQSTCYCTPYKQNINGEKSCKIERVCPSNECSDLSYINSYSYLEHEFKQAVKKDKSIIILYNSLSKEQSWIPTYMIDYEKKGIPFWIKNDCGERVGNYQYIKEVLGF